MLHLQRYRDIIDDFDAFVEANLQPLPRVVWQNPMRAPADVADRIRSLCPEATEIPWYPGAWKLPHTSRPGKWDIYQMGWIHAQEEAALLPATLLNARPGQRILDLCASPANKTAQIALAADDRAHIVANEGAWKRIAPMRFNLDRLGITSVHITNVDGRRFVEPDWGHFDSALADVPCSCEGTARKASSPLSPERAGSFYNAALGLQIGLLRRALRVVRPGGLVVYATCTYAPEENERVLDAIDPEIADIVPIAVPDGLAVAPGIPQWEGRTFRPDVVNALRFYPHLNDAGGFFVALLRRRAQALPTDADDGGPADVQ